MRKKSKRDIQGNFRSKNLSGGLPQTPSGNQKAVQGAQGLPIQEALYLSSSEQGQDVQEWSYTPQGTRY